MKKYLFPAIILFIVAIALLVVLLRKPTTVEQTQSSTSNTTSPAQDTVTSADNAPPGSLHNLPVPTPVALARKTAAELLGVPEGDAIILSAFEKEWPDSCLGLAKKDEMCSQVITEGYEVTVQGSGKEVVYRTNNDGTIIRLQE
jgi:hypothetical protein